VSSASFAVPRGRNIQDIAAYTIDFSVRTFFLLKYVIL
jgi:hypothetical protein